jgi:hypothetical protein
MLQSLVLLNALSLLTERKKGKGEMARGLFSQSRHTLLLGFFWLLGAIKGCFKGRSLNFMCT